MCGSRHSWPPRKIWLECRQTGLLCGSAECMHVCVSVCREPLYKCIHMCITCICQLSVCLHLHLACQSVTQQLCQKRPILFCVGCRHLPVNSSCFLSVFLCLSVCQAATHKCLQIERSHRCRLKGSPQRELRNPSILVDIGDCR